MNKLPLDSVRAGLMNYRREFGLVENPKRGFYRLTAKGKMFLESLKNESPA